MYTFTLSLQIRLGAFQKKLPTLKFFDQFADNSEMLKATFGVEKINVLIDDAYHSDESIINTFIELQPYLDYNANGLTVVTKK